MIVHLLYFIKMYTPNKITSITTTCLFFMSVICLLFMQSWDSGHHYQSSTQGWAHKSCTPRRQHPAKIKSHAIYIYSILGTLSTKHIIWTVQQHGTQYCTVQSQDFWIFIGAEELSQIKSSPCSRGAGWRLKFDFWGGWGPMGVGGGGGHTAGNMANRFSHCRQTQTTGIRFRFPTKYWLSLELGCERGKSKI